MILYRIRQSDDMDIVGFLNAISQFGFQAIGDEESWSRYGGESFCYKATYMGRSIDFLVPEAGV